MKNIAQPNQTIRNAIPPKKAIFDGSDINVNAADSNSSETTIIIRKDLNIKLV
jgi:hypothetical protein